jgi:hypothetical protein
VALVLPGGGVRRCRGRRRRREGRGGGGLRGLLEVAGAPPGMQEVDEGEGDLPRGSPELFELPATAAGRDRGGEKEEDEERGWRRSSGGGGRRRWWSPEGGDGPELWPAEGWPARGPADGAGEGGRGWEPLTGPVDPG